jgi:hypothetical protein
MIGTQTLNHKMPGEVDKADFQDRPVHFGINRLIYRLQGDGDSIQLKWLLQSSFRE